MCMCREGVPSLGCVPGPCSTCDGSGGKTARTSFGDPPLLRLALSCHRPSQQPHKRSDRSETDDLDHVAPHLYQQRDSSRPVACTYAARRWPAEACVTASLDSSILPLGAFGDPFALEYNSSIQTKKIATSATRPPTIPQYPHDIYHALACEPHESFPRAPSPRHSIHPPGCVALHLGHGFCFLAG